MLIRFVGDPPPCLWIWNVSCMFHGRLRARAPFRHNDYQEGPAGIGVKHHVREIFRIERRDEEDLNDRLAKVNIVGIRSWPHAFCQRKSKFFPNCSHDFILRLYDCPQKPAPPAPIAIDTSMDGRRSTKRVRLSPQPLQPELPTPSLTDTTSSASSASTSSGASDSDSEASTTPDEDEILSQRTAAERPTPSASSSVASDSQSDSSEDEEDATATLPLRDRLASFLPQLKAANERTEALRRAGKLRTLDQVEGDGPHIEMNLGLGVLEEQGGGSSSSSDSDVEEGEDQGEEADGSSAGRREAVVSRSGESHVLGKLMSQPRTKRKSMIQEVEDAG